MDNQQEEISLLDLWQLFRKHMGKILGLTLLGATIAAVFMFLAVKPEFASRAQLIVNQQQQGPQTNIQLNEIQTSVQLINTYRDILTADSVLAEVNQRMNDKFTIGQLKKSISVDQTQNSQSFNVGVTLESPVDAQEVLTQVIDVFESKVAEVYQEENTNITVLSEPSYNPNKVSPSLPIYLIIGAFIGGALSLLWILIAEISDTTVKNDDFLMELGLINLGSINQLSSKDLKESQSGGRRNDRKGKRV